MAKLILVRHGQSIWNLEGRFTGWTDVGLTPVGHEQAATAGQLLKKKKIIIHQAFTSYLSRAYDTLTDILEVLGCKDLPIQQSWRLNERHYGQLQGMYKTHPSSYSPETIFMWQRSFDVAPPPIFFNDPRHPRFDKKYQNIPVEQLPVSESLYDTMVRFLPYWYTSILPGLEAGKNTIISAHGNSLRALIKYIEKISDQDIVSVNVPHAIPAIYDFISESKLFLKQH